jgi:DNA polymerase epsilon subunit 2
LFTIATGTNATTADMNKFRVCDLFWFLNKYYFQLRTIEELLGSAGRIENIVVLGMLVQLKPVCFNYSCLFIYLKLFQGKYHLEDPSGTVELDLSAATFHTGLFTENCVVLIEGMMWSHFCINTHTRTNTPTYTGTYTSLKRISVTAVGMPPIELAPISRQFIGTALKPFGETRVPPPSARLLNIERIHDETAFVFVSDVCLDAPNVSFVIFKELVFLLGVWNVWMFL